MPLNSSRHNSPHTSGRCWAVVLVLLGAAALTVIGVAQLSKSQTFPIIWPNKAPSRRPYTSRRGTRSRARIFAVLAGLSVAAFSLFGALWVNGNVPINTAIAVSLILGVATFLATSKSTVGKSR